VFGGKDLLVPSYFALRVIGVLAGGFCQVDTACIGLEIWENSACVRTPAVPAGGKWGTVRFVPKLPVSLALSTRRRPVQYVRVNNSVLVAPPALATMPMVRSDSAGTRGFVVITKLALVSPASTVTEDGTLARGNGISLPGFTLTVGKAPRPTSVGPPTASSSVTVPELSAPPTIVDGCSVRLARTPVPAAGVTVSQAETFVPA